MEGVWWHSAPYYANSDVRSILRYCALLKLLGMRTISKINTFQKA